MSHRLRAPRWSLLAGGMLLATTLALPAQAWQFSGVGSRSGPGQWTNAAHPRSLVGHPRGGRAGNWGPAWGWSGHRGHGGACGPLHRHYPVFHYGHAFRPRWVAGPGWGLPYYPRVYRSHLFVGFSHRVVHPFYPVFPVHPFSPVIVCPPVVVPFYPVIGTSLWLGVARPVLPARLVLGAPIGAEGALTDELAAMVAARREELAARAAAGLRGDGLDSVFVRIGSTYDAARSLQAGDIAFRAQRYGNATEFYRLAMTRPGGDTSNGHLRAGYALLAQSRYREAHHEFDLALRQMGQDDSLSFHLNELYVDESEKVEHLEQLAKASWQKPRDSHLATLIGLFLWHDGQTQRAKTFLLAAQRASEGRDHLSARLLERVDPVLMARR